MKASLVVLLVSLIALAQAAPSPRAEKTVAAALAQVGVTLNYDPSYTALSYPMGDVPMVRGVCTDVIIRALRAEGVDLQALVHEDMKRAWEAYPKLWGLRRPDSNIDHRRVANLEVFFARQGKALRLSTRGLDYRAGDIVTWTLPNGRLHIGFVTNRLEASGGRPLIVHNIGAGAQLEDVLFAWKLRMRFRYFKD
jgi:uncharacterized protein